MSDLSPEGEAPPPSLEGVGTWRALVRNFGALAFGEAGARLISFVVVLLLARRLGPSQFGVITLGMTLVGWFGLVVNSGTELLGVRDVARTPQRFRTISESVLGLRLALSIPVAAVFAASVLVFTSSHSARSVLLPFALVLPAVALNLRLMVLGVHGAKAIAAGNIASSALLLLTVPFLVESAGDAPRVPLLQLVAELCYGLLILGLVSKRFGLILPRVDLKAWSSTLRQSLPLMLNSLVRAASFSADVLIVGLILGTRSLGIYGAASKPVLFITGVIGLFSISFLSSYSAADSTAAAALFRRSLWMLSAAAVLVAVVLSAGAPGIVPLLFGGAYGGATAVLALLAWRIPITALGTPYGTVLIAKGRQGVLLRNSVVAAVVNIAGNVSLVLLFGMMGAAVARIISALVSTVLNYRSTIRLGLLHPIALGPRPLAFAGWTRAARNEAEGPS